VVFESETQVRWYEVPGERMEPGTSPTHSCVQNYLDNTQEVCMYVLLCEHLRTSDVSSGLAPENTRTKISRAAKIAANSTWCEVILEGPREDPDQETLTRSKIPRGNPGQPTALDGQFLADQYTECLFCILCSVGSKCYCLWWHGWQDSKVTSPGRTAFYCYILCRHPFPQTPNLIYS
jgi:hypothetical protein